MNDDNDTAAIKLVFKMHSIILYPLARTACTRNIGLRDHHCLSVCLSVCLFMAERNNTQHNHIFVPGSDSLITLE